MKKKFLYPLLLTLLSFGIGLSHASATTLTLDDFYGDNSSFFPFVINTYNSNSSKVDELISYWQDNYSTFYPYYFITYYGIQGDESYNLYAYSESYNVLQVPDSYMLESLAHEHIVITYDLENNILSHSSSSYSEGYNDYNAIFPIINHGMIYSVYSCNNDPDCTEYEHIIIPAHTDETLDFSHEAITICS